MAQRIKISAAAFDELSSKLGRVRTNRTPLTVTSVVFLRALEMPFEPDQVNVADLRKKLSKVTDVPALRAMAEGDPRVTASPFYEARLTELGAGEEPPEGEDEE